MARRYSKLKNLLVPHEGNKFHPHLFRRTAVIGLLLAVLIFEGAYVLDTQIAQNHEGFLASVLPAALLDLTNNDRASSGVAPLQYDAQLAQAAQLKANDMAQNGYFAHVSPDGKTPWHWLDTVGYSYTFAGENLAINFDDSSAVEVAWMNSPTHRANIVKPQYTRVGYAVAQGMYQGKKTTFVVQELAARPSDETVTAPVKKPSPVATAVQKVVAVVTPAATEEPEVVAQASARPAQPSVPAVAGEEVQKPEPAPATTSQPMILGSSQSQTTTSDSAFMRFLGRVAASPLSTSIYALGGLSILMLILLGYALLRHARVRYLEVLSGGLLVIIFTLSVLTYNVTHTSAPVLPSSAAAIMAAP